MVPRALSIDWMTAECRVVPSSPRNTMTSAGRRLRISSFTSSRYEFRGSKNQVPTNFDASADRAVPRYRPKVFPRSSPPARATEFTTCQTKPEQSMPTRPTQ
jgi:hypothetical protein